MNRIVLVTGGAGYIGSHTCKLLAERGYVPVTFDNLTRGNRWAVRWGPLIEGDLSNKEHIRAVLASYDIAAVVHFAAYAYVGESASVPGLYFRNNVANTLNLLECLAEFRIRNFVFSSTCAVYGIPSALPIVEHSPVNPINPYGESKRQVESMLSWLSKAYDLNWTALRYFNAAGADPAGQIGECHDPETHLIPLAIQAALGHGPALKIFGSDYPTPDGSAIRDYIHVTDLADAHVRALEQLFSEGPRGIFNLGTGHGISVREVVSEVENVTGQPVQAEIAPRRPGDPPELVADSRLAKEKLGWVPKYSDLSTLVRTAVDWEKQLRRLQAAE